MTPHAFITKWRASELKERSASQEHFLDLCRLLGEPTSAEADPTGAGRRADLDAAFDQLRQYSLALENPPLLIVSDMVRFWIRTNWTNSVSQTHEFELEDLADAATRDRLKWVFSDPDRLRPGETRRSTHGARGGVIRGGGAGAAGARARAAGGGALREPAVGRATSSGPRCLSRSTPAPLASDERDHLRPRYPIPDWPRAGELAADELHVGRREPRGPPVARLHVGQRQATAPQPGTRLARGDRTGHGRAASRGGLELPHERGREVADLPTLAALRTAPRRTEPAAPGPGSGSRRPHGSQSRGRPPARGAPTGSARHSTANVSWSPTVTRP